MSNAPPLPPPGFDDLPVEEKLDYVQSLWDRIVAHPEGVPVPDWHQGIIEERLEDHRTDPDGARPGEEVRKEIVAQLRSRPSTAYPSS